MDITVFFARVNFPLVDLAWTTSATHLALFGYICWYFLLTAWIVFHRTYLVLTAQKKANAFSTTGEDVSPFAERLCRAHANCYENFPIFGGLMLLALLSGKASVTDSLALILLGSRLAQSIVHMSSTSELAVKARFTFFAAQIGVAAYWIAMLSSTWFT